MCRVKVFFYGALTGIILTLVVAGAWYYHRPQPKTGTRTVYVERKEPKKIAVPPVAMVRYLYRLQTDTVLVPVALPRLFDLRGVIGPRPLDVHRRYVSLRYFSPDSLRYVEERYDLQEPTWGLWVDADAGYWRGLGFYSGTHVNLRKGRTTVYVGTVVYSGGGPALRFGVRRQLFGFR